MYRPISSLGRRVLTANSVCLVKQYPQSVCASSRMLSSQASLDLRGIFPPLPTPFKENEDVDYDKMKENVDKMNTYGFRGLIVHGSNGECAFLNTEERIQTLKKIREWTPKDKLVLAGTGLESTRHTIELTLSAAAAGADGVMVVTPCYYKGRMTNDALIAHYTQVADASPLPVILYSVPGNTTIDLAPEVIVNLSTHPNIIGLKDSGGDIAKLANLVYKTQDNNFQVLAGSTGFLYPSLAVGCVGGVCGLANVLPAENVELQNLAEAGKLEEAKKLQHRMVMPNAGVTRMFGIAGLKTAMEWFGFSGGRTRSPLQPLTDQEKVALRKIFVNNGFLK